jgi:hypothetical protein
VVAHLVTAAVPEKRLWCDKASQNRAILFLILFAKRGGTPFPSPEWRFQPPKNNSNSLGNWLQRNNTL